MRTPTKEQLAVLDSPARIRVVRAAPGSGKTWLVAEVIRRELESSTANSSGIAALSFTRVGGDEIRNAVGYELGHPHFIGTLDAFLFRYVLRPFWRGVRPQCAQPRMIPADWLPEHWTKGPAGAQLTVARSGGVAPYKILEARFIGEANGACVIGCPAPFRSGLEPLPLQTASAVLQAKNRMWEKLGWLTHSDAAFLASQVLSDQKHGGVIVGELVRRFPFIIVDELQDTGWYLGKSVESILAQEYVRGLLVGDPDQAIYEFNGARPDLFDRFAKLPGAAELNLGKTRRCCSAVCRVAECLAQSGRRIGEADDRSGKAVLLCYNDVTADIEKLRKHHSNGPAGRNVRLIARHRNTIDSMAGKLGKDAPALGSVPLNHMQRAIAAYRVGRQARALAAARSALEIVVFDEEGVHETKLRELGVEPDAWKRTAVESLLSANQEVIGESLFDWGVRTASAIREAIQRLAATTGGHITVPTIRNPQNKHKNAKRDGYLFRPAGVTQTAMTVAAQTVHSVKGETHDLTIFVCPPAQAARCPSQIWWSNAPADLEERRIAFVAMTRTSGDLIVCVSAECLGRLKTHRAAFVSLFECMSIDGFLAIGSAGDPSDHAPEADSPSREA